MAEQKKTMDSGHNAFRVEVVTTPEQFLHVMGIRAICYTEDTQFPMNHAIDGNDYQCTHVVCYLGDEPIGAGRIRWFKDFAKSERTAFRPRFRQMCYLKGYADFICGHIAKKGYSRLIIHAQTDRLKSRPVRLVFDWLCDVFSADNPIFSREFNPKITPQQVISQTLRHISIGSGLTR